MIWFTSDWHIGHENIIKYCDRPFKNADEMNKVIMDTFNMLVKPEDTTYFLGDFCLLKRTKDTDPTVQDYMNMMHGYKIFLWGNHDKTQLFKTFPIECVYEGFGRKIHLNHFPNNARLSGFDIALCGHIHEKWKSKGKLVNVGVDVWDFKPVSILEIIREVKRNANT